MCQIYSGAVPHNLVFSESLYQYTTLIGVSLLFPSPFYTRENIDGVRDFLHRKIKYAVTYMDILFYVQIFIQ